MSLNHLSTSAFHPWDAVSTHVRSMRVSEVWCISIGVGVSSKSRVHRLRGLGASLMMSSNEVFRSVSNLVNVSLMSLASF